jgi:pyruvate dehydrogenase E2 component (dihydrolipoamide acetyltransferase)
MAEALGVDLTSLTGTGPQGTIRMKDVESAARTAPAPAQLPEATKPAAVTPERRNGMRQAIAAAVTRSKREIPHYYLSTVIEMTRALGWLESENKQRSLQDRLLPAALLIKAVALAVRAVPDVNGFWRDGGFQMSQAIHVGVAISLREGGLFAPAIHDTDRLTIDALMKALRDLVERTRAGGLRGSELTDPTITVTNLGDRGVDSVFGIIHPPQVAIVGFGRIVERPWALNGALAVRPTVAVSLAADHRASDGHRGGLFLGALEKLLQEPEKL